MSDRPPTWVMKSQCFHVCNSSGSHVCTIFVNFFHSHSRSRWRQPSSGRETHEVLPLLLLLLLLSLFFDMQQSAEEKRLFHAFPPGNLELCLLFIVIEIYENHSNTTIKNMVTCS